MSARRWFLWGALGLSAAGLAFLNTRPEQVEVVVVRAAPITQTVLASGTVSPPAELRLGSLVSTTASEVLVEEGDLVTEGMLLVQLDGSEAKSAVEEAKARLRSAKAGRIELKRLSAPAAQARLEEAEANLVRAKRRFERETKLHKSRVTTDVELEDADNAYSLAKAQKSAAVLQVQAASRGGSQSLATEAAIAQAEAQLKSSEERLRKHSIVAPSDGLILSRNVEPGDAVAAGSLLILLSRAGQTRLVIEPDERVLSLIRPGQRARASTEAFADQQFDAKVSTIAPAVDPKRGTIEVALIVEEPPPYLKPHMTTSVEVIVATKEQALAVPQSAILHEQSNPHVLIVRHGKLESRGVTLGIRGDDTVEILQGLEEGVLVVRVPGGLSAGMRVRYNERKVSIEGARL